MSFFSKSVEKLKSSADVVDGKLILSFPEALKPVVWKLDLNENTSSSLEIQEFQQQFILMMKPDSGEKKEIAKFETKEEAIKSLMIVSKALQQAHGKIKAYESSNENVLRAPAHRHGNSQKSSVMPVILSILIIFGLIYVWNLVSLPTRINAGAEFAPAVTAPQASRTQPAPAPNTETGVPLSADEFLRGR